MKNQKWGLGCQTGDKSSEHSEKELKGGISWGEPDRSCVKRGFMKES